MRKEAAFQNQVNNDVSKTINLQHSAGIDEEGEAFLVAWDSGCKGITVFRYGSRKQQVLYLSGEVEGEPGEGHVRAGPEYAGGCPVVDCEI